VPLPDPVPVPEPVPETRSAARSVAAAPTASAAVPSAFSAPASAASSEAAASSVPDFRVLRLLFRNRKGHRLGLGDERRVLLDHLPHDLQAHLLGEALVGGAVDDSLEGLDDLGHARAGGGELVRRAFDQQVALSHGDELDFLDPRVQGSGCL
jgi:hypothetical protein